MPTFIGTIILEDVNGRPTHTVDFHAHPVRREREIVTHLGVYAAHRQTPSGTWVYRYDRILAPHQPELEYLHTFTSL